jgi:hypothetical protein
LGWEKVTFQKPNEPREEARLGQYRLYFLDSVAEDQLISASLEFEAANDDDAIRVADGLRDARHAELWSGPRKLKIWDVQL